MRAFVIVGTILTALALPGAGHAHIALTSPTPRYADLKLPPCGRGAGDARTSNVTTFRPGETITVAWTETIDHPGHYRISFDSDGQDAFVEPTGFADFYTAPSVLVDNIADRSGSQLKYTQQVTLPNIECSNCTLQVIQVMTDKPPYGNGDDIYHQCADLVLSSGATGGGGSTGGPPPPPAPAAQETGCSVARAGAAGGAGPWALVILVFGMRRLRRLF